jgi:thiamine biosynthesis protein ThiS
MFTIQVNGEPFNVEPPLTVQGLIRKIQVHSPAIAVAVNSEIVPRSAFDAVVLKADDRIEIIRPVGGGCL